MDDISISLSSRGYHTTALSVTHHTLKTRIRQLTGSGRVITARYPNPVPGGPAKFTTRPTSSFGVSCEQGLKARGNVEDWLGKVEESMFHSLKKLVRLAMTDYENKSREDWVLLHASQVSCSVTQLPIHLHGPGAPHGQKG